MTKKFAAEDLLQVALPNYEVEHFQVLCWLAASACVWLWVRQAFLTIKNVKTLPSLAIAFMKRTLPAIFLYGVAIFGFLLTAAGVAFWLSPHNTYTPRRVFQAPAFNQSECDQLLGMAHSVAARQYGTLEEARATYKIKHHGNDDDDDDDFPGGDHISAEPHAGWRTNQQHGGYTTCDLSLVHDSFSKQDRDYLSDLLDRRVAPIISRIFHVPPSALRANDMFIVLRSDYYDDGSEEDLDTHIDNSDISISILLNDHQDFQGGGTQYFNRYLDQSFAYVSPKHAGELVTHASDIRHRALQVTQGTRYYLLANLAVDSIDPWTKQSNGLSIWASWFNARWLGTRFDEGLQAADRNAGRKNRRLLHHPYVADYFLQGMVHWMEYFLDKYAPHAVESLVAALSDDDDDDDAKAKAKRFVQSLDSHYEKVGQYQPKANWYKGQMINRDIDGSIENEWTMREDNPGVWSEL
jgi:hypothetical protein